MKKKKAKTPSQLKKQADAVFSIYIRTKYAIAPKREFARCYTCNALKSIKKLQCGHFISRLYLATRWNEKNCRPQCVGCNIWGRGKPLEFEESLVKEYGEDEIRQMKESRKKVLKISPDAYLAMIYHFKVLTAAL